MISMRGGETHQWYVTTEPEGRDECGRAKTAIENRKKDKKKERKICRYCFHK